MATEPQTDPLTGFDPKGFRPVVGGTMDDLDGLAQRVHELESQDTGSDETPGALSEALTDLGRALRDLGDHVGAEAAIRRAVAIREGLARSGSGKRELADSYSDLGKVLYRAKRDKEAGECWEHALRIYRELRNEESEPKLVCRIAGRLLDLGYVARWADRVADAGDLFACAATELDPLLSRILEQDDQVDVLRELAFVRVSEASLFASLDRHTAAETARRQAAELHERLLAENPVHEDRTEWLAELGEQLARLGTLLENRDRFLEAETVLRRAIECLTEVADAKGAPKEHENATRHLVGALRTLETVLYNFGRPDEARAVRAAARARNRERGPR